ncbi:MAG: D-alanine--D-alanine ligase A, partial [Deltaproteobacteria bacterium]|nr:D-alanine--D-alanine ligase A [Deltaproteobacteria bacterium]
MAKKLRVGVLFGGRSGEHEISLLSAASVFKAIDPELYEVVPIGITKQGQWVTSADAERLLAGKSLEQERPLRAGDPEATSSAALLANGQAVVVPPAPHKSGSSLAPFQTNRPAR